MFNQINDNMAYSKELIPAINPDECIKRPATPDLNIKPVDQSIYQQVVQQNNQQIVQQVVQQNAVSLANQSGKKSKRKRKWWLDIPCDEDGNIIPSNGISLNEDEQALQKEVNISRKRSISASKRGRNSEGNFLQSAIKFSPCNVQDKSQDDK